MNLILSLSLSLSVLSASSNMHSGTLLNYDSNNGIEFLQKQDEKYEQLKKRDYATLSEAEKLYFKNALINLLKNDVAYQEYLKLRNENSAQYLSRKKTSRETLGRPPKEREAQIEYYRKKGLLDPVAFVDNTKKATILFFSVFGKHPELRKLGPKDRLEVLSHFN
ncbi:MAG: hypothetical protein P0Y49_05070 [Candidatus Pedobacter colombiensis]|uniref:Uncharacterized protein n=1 Tax=Candidatus Pedobacter colombiensis TaxID=3121371 RepID=A0AAJ6B6Y1_9SPHI|nr:hypothetical protein [Pedobacter sp.]WEK20507.1 MAG: hypothetical protein P0Y49_05070 [Pedobacter sp.]